MKVGGAERSESMQEFPTQMFDASVFDIGSGAERVDIDLKRQVFMKVSSSY